MAEFSPLLSHQTLLVSFQPTAGKDKKEVARPIQNDKEDWTSFLSLDRMSLLMTIFR